MKKNCTTCGCFAIESDSWEMPHILENVCVKRDMTEGNLAENMQEPKYLSRYKRCYEPKTTENKTDIICTKS